MKAEVDTDARIIIVGSGAGGATVAKELALAEKGKEVVLLEAGPYTKPAHAYKYYDKIVSKHGIEVARALCIGGTTLVSAGNGMRRVEEELKELGINLSHEFSELERELRIKPVPDECIGEGTKKLIGASAELGYETKAMPKFTNFDTCKSKSCGNCTLGCPTDAKWNAANWVEEAKRRGVKVVPGLEVEKVVIEKGKAVGVEAKGKEFRSNLVILAAGGIGTPRILHASGVSSRGDGEVGRNLFVDPFVTIGGVIRDINFNKEISMACSISDKNFDGFMLAPHYSRHLVRALSLRGYSIADKDVLGLMVKIKDGMSGVVHEDGTIEKYLNAEETSALIRGTIVAAEILDRAGVEPKSICTTPVRGAHPGGTAAIGKVVNSNLETEVEGLFVADASVIPITPGGPPMLTIMALAKRLAKRITREF